MFFAKYPIETEILSCSLCKKSFDMPIGVDISEKGITTIRYCPNHKGGYGSPAMYHKQKFDIEKLNIMIAELR